MSRLTAPSLLRRVLESRPLPTPHTAPSSEWSGSVSQHERLATSGGCLSSQPLYPSHVVSHGWCCWTLPAVAGTGLHCSPAHLLTVRTGATHNGWAPQHHTTPHNTTAPTKDFYQTAHSCTQNTSHHITSHHITVTHYNNPTQYVYSPGMLRQSQVWVAQYLLYYITE